MTATTEEATAAAAREIQINDYLTGCSSEWRVELVGDRSGLYYRVHDSDGEIVPHLRLPVTVDGITVRAVESAVDRAYDRGRERGVKVTQQAVCNVIGAKWQDWL